MIINQLEDRHQHLYGPAWEIAFNFLAGLSGEAEERRYALQGDDIYAAIESYDTKPPRSTLPEAHRRYVDIQMVLSGNEQIAWWPARDLSILKPYVAEKDIAFFDRPDSAGILLDMVPGRFAVFFTSDAHMPCLQTGSTSTCVKKVVVKIRADLL